MTTSAEQAMAPLPDRTMKPKDPGHVPVITFLAHPPERSRRPSTALYAGGCCCCCCCCCLHSLGSLAGAVVGSFYQRDTPAPYGKLPSAAKLRDDELDGSATVAPAKLSVTPLYWLGTLAAAA